MPYTTTSLWEPRTMRIADIVIGDRHRKDLGDLQDLAKSILAEGLLQPIGVTEARDLVFGYRRVVACRDLLGWTEIPARVVKVTSIAEGEFAENEIRKNFTPSERVALAQAIRGRLRRPGPKPRAPDGSFVREAIPRPRDSHIGTAEYVAAKRVGFGSHMTLRRAERVVAKGVPSLIAAMDNGTVSIGAASALAALDPVAQEMALAAGTVTEVAHRRRRARHAAQVASTTPSGKMAGAKATYSPGVKRSRRHDMNKIWDSTVGLVLSAGMTFREYEGEEILASSDTVQRWIDAMRLAQPAIKHFLARCESHLAKGTVPV